MNISSKELKKWPEPAFGKYGTFIGTNVLYILITLVASNLMDLVLGTSSILNPLTATSATVERLVSVTPWFIICRPLFSH